MRALPLLAAAALLAVALPAMPAQAASFTVSAMNFYWTPATLTVAPGDTVTFVNGAGAHSWVSDSGMGACALPCTKSFPTAGTFNYHCGAHPSMVGSVKVAVVPTVTITAPAPSDTVSGAVSVTGTVTHPTGPITAVKVRFGSGSYTTATITGSGTSATWSASLDSTTVANGAQTIQALATAAATDGSATVGVTVANPLVVDLRPTTFTGTTGTTASSLSYTVQNGGNTAAGAFTVKAEYLYDGVWKTIGTRSHTGLAAFTSTTSSISWTGGGFLVGRFDTRLTVDSLNAVAESDETNNVRAGTASFFTNAVGGVDVRNP